MENRRQMLMVGVFVAVASAVVFAVIFLLGQERSLFESTTSLYLHFKDVGGLKPGSQVRLAGTQVGSVSSIEFAQLLEEKKVVVQIKVRSSVMPRIRKDSVAIIGSKGLLGDKVIELSVGSPEYPQLAEGDSMKSEEPPDVFKILEKAQVLISNGAEMMGDLKEAVKKFSDEETVANVKGTIHSLKELFEEVETGNGVIHGLIYDEHLNVDVKTTMGNVRDASMRLRNTIENVEHMVQQVRTGDNAVHFLIYDAKGKVLVENLQEASANLSDLLGAVKTGDGMLHSLIYEEGKNNLIKNLEDASAQIKNMLAYIESGQGTIGGLLKDPTVYEDLKIILGNLKRNELLKSLIRFQLEKAEEEQAKKREDKRIQPDSVKSPETK